MIPRNVSGDEKLKWREEMHKEVDELKNISTWMFKKKSYMP